MLPRIPFLRLPLLGLSLPTYGLLVALGFVCALVLVERLARRHGFLPHEVQDLVVWGSLWGLLGAKLALVLLEPSELWHEPWRLVFEGGVFYGGLVAAVTATFLRCWRR